MSSVGNNRSGRSSSSAFRRPTVWLLAALLTLAVLVRFRALAFGLPYTQARPDETAIIEPVRTLLAGHLPHFYDYPWLYLWIVSVAYLGYFVWGAMLGTFHSLGEMLASWPIHWAPFFLIPRAITATFGAASILLIYRLGRQLRDDATGIVSALFLTFAFSHVRNSHFGTTDVPMTFFILASMTLLLDAHRTKRPATFAAAGFIAGLAAATKYNAVLLVMPMLASYALTVVGSPGHRRDALVDTRLLSFGIPFALAIAVGIPFLVLDPQRFLDAMGELAHALTVGDPRIALANGWVHNLLFSLRYEMGPALLATGLAGAAALLWLEPRAGILFLAFPVTYYIVVGSFRLLFARYVLPIVPFLCVAAAYLICRAMSALASRLRADPAQRARAFRLGAGVVALAVVWPSVERAWAFDRVMAQDDSRVVAARWFTEHVPPGSSVLQSGSRYGLIQFWERSLAYQEWRWDGGRGVFLVNGKRPEASDRPQWIVVQDSPLPSATQDIVKEFLKEPYVLAASFSAFSPGADLVYHQLDAFFVPLNGFEHVERPGPNFSVFKRVGAGPDREARAVAR